ncbi:hypothetical protein TGS27_1976 [Geobacillus stearothermophilus]|uniref:Uncharacterized protein n=1 Tax=Geobacillus stearothermophilus TaxID=1422 RepID=A0A150MAY8_GEOSE|nr:hypothetical protein GS8_2174 [Geobacillus stearothermophilus]KYD21720.1 hypothetical protein B4109_2045 [Geobacillus stearothermophilus]OAO80147.1 hypothetical protein TGS27_1976 [Geobacillus stearothermophilus]
MAQCFNRLACPRFLFTYFQHTVDRFFIMTSYSIWLPFVPKPMH